MERIKQLIAAVNKWRQGLCRVILEVPQTRWTGALSEPLQIMSSLPAIFRAEFLIEMMLYFNHLRVFYDERVAFVDFAISN